MEREKKDFGGNRLTGLDICLTKSSSEAQGANCPPEVGFASGGATLGGLPFVASKVCISET